MKQTPVLLNTFTADAAVPRANLCLVMSGTNAGNVAAPGGAQALKFIGVSQEPTDSTFNSAKGNSLDVQLLGIAQIETDGSAGITAGDTVQIANTTGQIKTVVPATGTTLRQNVGIAMNTVAATAGLLVDVFLVPHYYVGA